MFRFLLNFIGFLLSFVFTEKIMHEVWHLRNVIYSFYCKMSFQINRKRWAFLLSINFKWWKEYFNR